MRSGGKCIPLFVHLELLLIFTGLKRGLRCDSSFAADNFRNILDELTGLQNFFLRRLEWLRFCKDVSSGCCRMLFIYLYRILQVFPSPLTVVPFLEFFDVRSTISYILTRTHKCNYKDGKWCKHIFRHLPSCFTTGGITTSWLKNWSAIRTSASSEQKPESGISGGYYLLDAERRMFWENQNSGKNRRRYKSFPTRRASPKPSKQMVALVRRKLGGQLPCIAPTANCMMPRQTPCRAALQDAGNSHVITDHHAKLLFRHLALAELSTF